MSDTNTSNSNRPHRWLVTLGPTHEPIDGVRFIGNRSSGRMGFEIAKAARETGAHARILAGPCCMAEINSWSDLARFQTAGDLRGLLEREWHAFDVLVMAAAVADWRVVGSPLSGKIRRSDTAPVLALEPVPEILGNLPSRADQFVVGFALEPKDQVVASAGLKLKSKKADCIVANSLESLDSTRSDAVIVWGANRVVKRPGAEAFADKSIVARWIVDSISPAIAQKCRNR